MTDHNDRPDHPLPPPYAAQHEAELEYSRRLEGDIAATAHQFGRCKTKWEMNIVWSHLSHLIQCRTAQQIIRMEIARGLQ